jgi:hypothetical protein
MIETIIEYPSGGKIDVYTLVDKEGSDYKNIVACCEYFAKQGAKTVIYPRFTVTKKNPLYQSIFAFLKDTPYWGKCPDFSVNGVWYEHEGYDKTKDLSVPQKKSDTFCYMLKRGIKQSNRIVVEDTGVWRQWARRIIYNRVHLEKQNISEVYIRTDVGLELLYKS